MGISAVQTGSGFLVSVTPELRNTNSVNGSAAVGLNDRVVATLTGVTDASGFVMFNLTRDGTAGGIALFTAIHSINSTAQFNSATATDVPRTAIRSVSGDLKQVQVAVTDGRVLTVVGATEEAVAAGLTVYLEVIGV